MVNLFIYFFSRYLIINWKIIFQFCFFQYSSLYYKTEEIAEKLYRGRARDNRD